VISLRYRCSFRYLFLPRSTSHVRCRGTCVVAGALPFGRFLVMRCCRLLVYRFHRFLFADCRAFCLPFPAVLRRCSPAYPPPPPFCSVRSLFLHVPVGSPISYRHHHLYRSWSRSGFLPPLPCSARSAVCRSPPFLPFTACLPATCVLRFAFYVTFYVELRCLPLRYVPFVPYVRCSTGVISRSTVRCSPFRSLFCSTVYVLRS